VFWWPRELSRGLRRHGSSSRSASAATPAACLRATAAACLCAPAARGGAGRSEVQATEAPPPLPEYDQPPCPEDGWLWTPGYWAYSTGGYYWIPGTWVAPPQVGVLWTPGLLGIRGWRLPVPRRYWGPHVGFYGGVNYGFGYGGVGFVGGRWAGNSFAYNTGSGPLNTTVISQHLQ